MTRADKLPLLLSEPGAAERVFLRFWHKSERRDITHGDFWRAVSAQMQILASGEQGVEQVDLLVGHVSPELIIMFTALAACGRLPAIFPPNTAVQDRRTYFSQQRASLARIDCRTVYVADPALAEVIAEIDPALAQRIALIPSDTSFRGDGEDAAHRFGARLKANAPIFVQHSSGTTGVKKSVGISGPKLLAQYNAYWPSLKAEQDGGTCAIASWLPLYHDMGLLTSVLLPMLGGDTVSLIDPFEWIRRPGSLFDMIEADGCTTAWMPNFAFRHLVRSKPLMRERRLDSMKAWINCSEPCRLADVLMFEREFATWGVRQNSVRGCYAMAETVFAVTQAAPDTARRGMLAAFELSIGTDLREQGAALVEGAYEPNSTMSSGRVLPHFDVGIMANGELLPEWHYGEIVVRGVALFDSYRKISSRESGIDAAGWYHTGDLGVFVSGELYVIGRSKDVIIINGRNLHAPDVEEVVQAVPGIRPGRAVAFGLYSEATGSEQLFIVAETNAEPGLRHDIAKAVAATISATFLVAPSGVELVEERWLIKTTSGKISRRANAEKFQEAMAQRIPSARNLAATAS